jgi:DNA-binding HxlR family transcriptional regulator
MHDDVGATTRERLGEGAAHVPRATGDHSDLSCEQFRHGDIDKRSGFQSQEGTRTSYTYLQETMKLTRARRRELVHEMLGRIGDKWTLLVLDALDEDGELRFSRLREHVPGISQKVLTKVLRQLERDGLVSRTVHPVIPPHVDYRLTDLGETLGASLCGLWEWVEANVDAVERARTRYAGRVQ